MTTNRIKTPLTAAASTPELVLERVRLRARRRVAWLRLLWQQQLAAGERADLPGGHMEIDAYLRVADEPAAEGRWYEEDEAMQRMNVAIEKVEAALLADKTSRLAQLTALFGLSVEEQDTLQACLALAIESNLERVFAYLHDDSNRPYITGELTGRLFGHGLYSVFGAGSPLRVWGLITETTSGISGPAKLECDPFVRNWLLGQDEFGDLLTGKARMQGLQEALEGWPVADTLRTLKRIMEGPAPMPAVRLYIAGADGSGRCSFAACLCKELGLQLVRIDSGQISEDRWLTTYRHAQRYAWLNRVALAWRGAPARERYWPAAIAPYPLQFMIGEPDEEVAPAEDVIDLRIELPPLLLGERARLWQQLVPASSFWPEPEFAAMIRRHACVVGQIVDVAQKCASGVAEASEILREGSRRRLGELAKLMTGAFGWDDLVVSPILRQGLEDLYFEASERALLWERPGIRRLFPQGKGLFALFNGEPGTGKTMAAQVVANALQLDLFRIDLSSVVSKYVGETSRNIERVLSRAQRMDIVLFFDEADALFGKRTEIKDAHDRFANTDTNYLLQALEQYPGVVILASNKKQNMDTAFTRRLRYILEFPRPDSRQRLELWRRISVGLGGGDVSAALDEGLQRLAEMAELTGAQIKLALLSAILIAHREQSPLEMRHVIRGLEKELLKDERPLPRQIKEYFKI